MYLYSDHSTMNTDMRFYASVMLRKQLLEENLRILYVAMTRAKKGLYLFATAEDGNARSAAYELQWEKGIVDLSEATCFYDWLSPLYALKKRHPTVELFGKAKAKGIGVADERLIKMLNTHFDMPYLRYAPSKSYVSLIAHAADEEEEESIGQNVVLVDDIVDTAGTITKAANIMLEAGAASVRAIASHCVMSDPASFRVQESGLTEMVFTDSIPYSKKCAKVKQLSIADMFAETIKRVVNNESISSQYII